MGRQPFLRNSYRDARWFTKLQRAQVKGFIEYRADFWLGVLGALLEQAAGVIFLMTAFHYTRSIGSWTREGVFLLFGLLLVPRGIVEVFCNGPWTLKNQVNRGSLDLILLRPMSPAVQIAASSVGLQGVSQCLIGLGLLGYAAGAAGINWTPGLICYLIVTLFFSILLMVAMTFLANSIWFFQDGSESAAPQAYARLIDLGKYPLDVYGSGLRLVLVTVAPFAFASYFPASVLLDRGGLAEWMGFAAPAAIVFFCLIVRSIWRLGLKRYASAGH